MSPIITFEGFGYRFAGAQRWALKDVSVSIHAGEFVVVVGPSGGGKSTLALALGGYLFNQYDGEAVGSLTVAGLDVAHTPVYDVAEIVGLVQQNPEAQFCTLTVRDEMAFGLENRCLPPAEIRQRIAWALDVVRGTDLIDRHLATLSGGEQQKVAIAAMLATRPQILIFDEPTSNLDPTATAEIFEVIAEIRARSQITVIVIEHKVAYLDRFSPRLIKIEAGEIVGDGRLMERREIRTGEARRVALPAPTAPPVIRISGLEAGYDGAAVLGDLSLVVRAGELVALMGDNGSGKTTLLHLLSGLERPSVGSLDVLGNDPAVVPVSRLARQIGVVFQNPEHQLFAATVWEEAIFAARNFGMLDEAVSARATDLLARCGLSDRLDDHPYRLSYGEKRRLNLVSILVYEPRLILLDEILIGQDDANVAFLMGLLMAHVARGGTALMVNHSPEVALRYASRLVFLEAGQIIVDGPVDESFVRLARLGREAYLPRGCRLEGEP